MAKKPNRLYGSNPTSQRVIIEESGKQQLLPGTLPHRTTLPELARQSWSMGDKLGRLRVDSSGRYSGTMSYRPARFPTRYLEAIEAQIQLAKFYDKVPAGAGGSILTDGGNDPQVHRSISAAASSMLLLANPIFVSPDISSMLDDAMGGIDPGMALYPTDVPCEYGFAYLGGEEWPLSNNLDGFTSTVRAMAWATYPSHILFAFFGRSYDPLNPSVDDDFLQLVEFANYSFGVPFIQFADANAEMMEARTPFHPTIKQEDVYRLIYDNQLTSLTYIAALWTFMKQKIAVRTPQGLDRPTRRRVEVEDGYQGGNFISVVHLRALDYSGRKAPEGEPGYRWKVRSLRRAHWHNYHCGGKSKQCAHKGGHDDIRLEPRWVAATVCGPEGAPLRGGTKLFAVVR